jgi:hypothetical protein
MIEYGPCSMVTMAWIIEQITALQLRAVREHKRE